MLAGSSCLALGRGSMPLEREELLSAEKSAVEASERLTKTPPFIDSELVFYARLLEEALLINDKKMKPANGGKLQT